VIRIQVTADNLQVTKTASTQNKPGNALHQGKQSSCIDRNEELIFTGTSRLLSPSVKSTCAAITAASAKR